MTQRTFAIALCALLVSATLPHQAHAASYKKEYCGNADYVTNNGPGNDGGKIYPHLHCGSSWISFSANKNNHKNFLDGSSFKKGQAVEACQNQGVQQAIKQVINRICTDNNEDCSAACS